MYIYSQNREAIVCFDSFSQLAISKNLAGGRERRFAIVASSPVASLDVLGYYAEEDAAKAELGRIMAALRSGAETYDVN